MASIPESPPRNVAEAFSFLRSPSSQRMNRLLVAIIPVVILALSAEPGPDSKKEQSSPRAPFKLPKEWNPADPLPIVKSNCVRCHLTAGRELTAPLRDFARSTHDFAHLSCNDCHGGDTEHDATAHESEHG